jgi:flagellar basal-body rod modification protein FlgD
MPSAISGVTDTTGTTTDPSTAASSATPQIDSQTFLNLLVAQLKYQDPTNPTTGTEMMAQTAQMYTVQALQAIQTQETASAAAEGTMATSSMIGKNVTATDSDGDAVTGIVSGVSVGTTGPMLQIGTKLAPLSGVTAITAGTTPDPTTPTT